MPTLKPYATQLHDLLWAGDIDAFKNADRWKPIRIVSVLQKRPEGCGWPYAAHWVLKALDDDVLEPKAILEAIAPKCLTLVHCQLGQNRSTAIAVCWLMLHEPSIWRANECRRHIETIERRRTLDLAELGRSRAEVSPQMRQNVWNFAAYLIAEGLNAG